MNRLRSILSQCRADAPLFALALLWVAAIRSGLALLPFPLMRRLLARFARSSNTSDCVDCPLEKQFARAVITASSCVPGATCLTRALAVQVLLARQGYVTRLRFGVANGANKKLAAHAWLETTNGRVILGAWPEGHYTRLPIPKESDVQKVINP